MRHLRFIRGAAFILGALALSSAMPATTGASSHSEAPGTAKDRLADDTDLYAFIAPDAPDKVTFVGNWIPLLEPNGGPNFYTFDEDVEYYINIDNAGDCLDHIRYQFKFKTTRRNPATFLYNTGMVTSLDDPDLNVRQTYTLTRLDNGSPTVLVRDGAVAPNNVGPASMPSYNDLAQAAVTTLPDGTKIFVGPRDDPFFVDLGAVFDLLTIRRIPGNMGGGVDGVGGFNVMTIAIQVPMTKLTKDGLAPNARNSVIGIYDSAERSRVRVLNEDGTVLNTGPDVQVSRLGMPLVNEVVIPLGAKDRFNHTKPTGDASFLSYVTDPELPKLFNLLYGLPIPTTPRNDLVSVFLTGIPGVNKPANPRQVPCEMLRLNMAIAPNTENPNRLGVIAGDASGFPNGRRLADDVVDVEERAAAGGYVLTPDFNNSPANALGDGVDENDLPFLPYFPYVAPPHSPFAHQHHREEPIHAASVPATASMQTAGAATADPAGAPKLSLRLAGQNPSPSSKLEFTIPKAGRVSLRLYDAQGRLVRTLVDQDAAPGSFTARWDGRAADGSQVAKGIYFARFTSGGESVEKKVVLN
ncbi:MAG TPA: DUF4331 family protein [Candidatus Eisenbacteria bacterium]